MARLNNEPSSQITDTEFIKLEELIPLGELINPSHEVILVTVGVRKVTRACVTQLVQALENHLAQHQESSEIFVDASKAFHYDTVALDPMLAFLKGGNHPIRSIDAHVRPQNGVVRSLMPIAVRLANFHLKSTGITITPHPTPESFEIAIGRAVGLNREKVLIEALKPS